MPIDTSKMSQPELQFHYFKMHDNDNNNKLDGSELIKSLIHWHGKMFDIDLTCNVFLYSNTFLLIHGNSFLTFSVH